MKIGDVAIRLEDFISASVVPATLEVTGQARKRLLENRKVVEEFANGAQPVYGLNTGLGANLDHRLMPKDIEAFQLQMIEGRSVGIGKTLPEPLSRGVLLYRIISAARGGSGINPELFDHLCNIYEAGLAPAIPETGSIGTGDLVQNAHFAGAVFGLGTMWVNGKLIVAEDALKEKNLRPPKLGPKDAMVLINHSGITVARCGFVLSRIAHWFETGKASALMAFEAYNANPDIFDEETNALRPAPGQLEVANWFRQQLQGCENDDHKIQDALSYRTIAPVYGSAWTALRNALDAWMLEMNGLSDSPVITGKKQMLSTSNFHSPALALALEAVCLANAMVANSIFQRIQKLMNPELSGLPKYLSPVGGSSAGFVPAQKTAASLLAEIRHSALPAAIDAPPVSETVEDMAPMTPLVAAKLERQLNSLETLTALEAVTGAQAMDLRQPKRTSPLTRKLHEHLRSKVMPMKEDRPLSPDIDNAIALLRDFQS